MQPCPKIVVVIPVYGAYPFALATLRSLFEHSDSNVAAIVVNDASPDPWPRQEFDKINGTVGYVHHEKNLGLNSAWNTGAHFALTEDPDAQYIALVNSDLQFTPGWWRGLCGVLDSGYDLVGPTSNSAGPTGGGIQDVRRWTSDYELTDYPAYLSALSEDLWNKHGTNVAPCAVNGMFMMATRQSWLKYGYKPPEQVFPPFIPRMPSGRKNPTPRLTGQDDWLSSHIRKRGGRTGCAIGSFIFHYRSATRGDKYKQEGAYRVDQH